MDRKKKYTLVDKRTGEKKELGILIEETSETNDGYKFLEFEKGYFIRIENG